MSAERNAGLFRRKKEARAKKKVITVEMNSQIGKISVDLNNINDKYLQLSTIYFICI